MGKRSNFERREKDFYPTPYEAVIPLFDHLESFTTYIEPCVGDKRLIEHLSRHFHKCVGWSDSEVDARTFQYPTDNIDCFITNPPWSREILHPIIENLSKQAPTWLLIDADWMHTKQSKPYMARCHKIVSVGRVKWIEGSKMTGKDNVCWYLFDACTPRVLTEFHGR